MRARKGKRGVTLIEVMLAGAILTLLSLALFNGISVAARIAHENAELLSAEAVAWDAVWKRFNEDYSRILPTDGWTSEALTSNAVPPLYAYYYMDNENPAAKPVLRMRVRKIPNFELLQIEADIDWGLSANRKRLSKRLPPDPLLPPEDDTSPIRIFRGELGRVVTW